jgi:diadenosine tetraphosphate (Ap4A) HIT family hydrolase
VAHTLRLRVIRADEPGFPAFYRVVWNAHVAEFSDLAATDRLHCMEAVARVESLLREHLRPDKVNLAALGNMVPHLHWHVVARWRWDSHFPSPIWAPPQRAVDAGQWAAVSARLPALDAAIAAALAEPR